MKDYGPSTFGELHAQTYDGLHDPGTTDEAVALLAGLIGHGKSLELAIGTGRIALPLTQRGIEVHGIDASPDMLAKLNEKPGGEKIPATVADMADFALDETFDFAYLVFNTLFNLTSQDAQVACFQQTANHLNPGGGFLIETFVPNRRDLIDSQHLKTKQLDAHSVTLEAIHHDPVHQVINFQRIHLSQNGMRLVPLPMRYAWPQEIDLMAKLAGLTLEERWGGWDKTPFTGDSQMHISVYRKP